MNSLWKIQAARIDALSLRERVILFTLAVVLMLAAFNVLVITPTLTERRNLTRQMQEQTTQLEALRAQLATGVATTTEQGPKQAELAAARTQLAAIETGIQEQLAGQDGVARLPELLDRLLQRHERLAITRLATVEDLPKVPESVLSWQAVDLSLSGSYPDLVRYLADLEASLPGLRWGRLDIASAVQPPVLSVRLMLPGDLR